MAPAHEIVLSLNTEEDPWQGMEWFVRREAN